MTFPLVRELAAEGIPVRLTCGVLGFSPQAFYKWQARPCSDRDWADAHTTNLIVDTPMTRQQAATGRSSQRRAMKV